MVLEGEEKNKGFIFKWFLLLEDISGTTVYM